MSETTTPRPALVDPLESTDSLLADLSSSEGGLEPAEAARRLLAYGPNELVGAKPRSLLRELGTQLAHPLALLLWAAAGLSAVTHSPAVAVAIVAVILLNAAFALAQERQARAAVALLSRYLPPEATVVRAGRRERVEARTLVPGDVVVIGEGDRVSADARLIGGAVRIDSSTLTGESVPVYRAADAGGGAADLIDVGDVVLSGTACVGGEALGLVFATGMTTELGRIASLTDRVEADESPLEQQVRRVAWLIAIVALAVGLAFLPLGTVAGGLSFSAAALFAIGLLVSNVPEGLLPTITLALGVGVRQLARRGALVKRLSAVETLGSTTVVCTDKTGTLTLNQMQVVQLWVAGGPRPVAGLDGSSSGPTIAPLIGAAARCTTARLRVDVDGRRVAVGDPTELALLDLARVAGHPLDTGRHDVERSVLFAFDSVRQLMSTVDEVAGEQWQHTKGAPESVVARCSSILAADGATQPLGPDDRSAVAAAAARFASDGLRVLAVARRQQPGPAPADRDAAESGLTLLGLVAMTDPPRPEVADAVRRCHEAGIRILVVTGDHALTAAAIARQVGIEPRHLVTSTELAAMRDADLDALLATGDEVVFARTSPEAKLRIADALRARGEVVAMTGDGVNDAPALRRADLGVAMGRSGTDVACDAATMVLTDDNFATIVTAVEQGRRVYDNVRKFILYIFAHATPEVVPFLLFALSGGRIPLPLTVLQILAIDLGTETLPALALGREPIEPGLMRRPPRPRDQGVIDGPMLRRAWAYLGGVSAVLVVAGFLGVLLHGGWHLGAAVGAGHALHDTYREATTMTFLGIVACQVGVAFAARTDRASLRSVGVASNPLLLGGLAFEVAIAAAITYLSPLQRVFGTMPPPAAALAVLPVFAAVVWGADELRRAVLRRRHPEGLDPTGDAL